MLMLVLGFIYSGHTDGKLMFDDKEQISHVSRFSSVTDTFTVDYFGLFRPIKNLVFYSWVTLMPDDYQAWRLTAVAIFVGLIPLAYVFFGLFFKDKPWLQLLGTALWACTPTTTAVVCWLSSTNIIIGCYGFFLYFLLYEKAQKVKSSGQIEKAYGWLFGSLLALAFACFSYEAAMTAPFLLILKDYTKNLERLKDKRTWVFLLLSLFTLSLYFLLRKFHGGITTFAVVPMIPTDSDFWVSFSSGWFYLIHAIRWLMPFGHQGILIMFNPENHKLLVIVSALLVLGLGIVLLVFQKRKPILLLSLGWYGLALFPMANVIPLKNGPICDYYLFIPGIGLAIFFTWLVQLALETKAKPWVSSLAVGWVTVFVCTTFLWVPHWTSIKSMAERTVQWQPENFVILGQLAQRAMDEKELDLAESYIERGLALAPWLASLQYERAMLYRDQENYQGSIEVLERLTVVHSQIAKPFVFLAYLYDIHLEDWQKAEKLLQTALEKPWHDKMSKMAAMNLAFIYIKTGREQFATKIYESLVARYPLDKEVTTNHKALLHMQKLDAESLNPTEDL